MSDGLNNGFHEKWPEVAQRIVKFRKKSGVSEVKQFWIEHNTWKDGNSTKYALVTKNFLTTYYYSFVKII